MTPPDLHVTEPAPLPPPPGRSGLRLVRGWHLHSRLELAGRLGGLAVLVSLLVWWVVRAHHLAPSSGTELDLLRSVLAADLAVYGLGLAGGLLRRYPVEIPAPAGGER